MWSILGFYLLWMHQEFWLYLISLQLKEIFLLFSFHNNYILFLSFNPSITCCPLDALLPSVAVAP